MARIVMKFGGTSMAGTERIRRVANIVRRQQLSASGERHEIAVVVSAMAGETDRLVNFCREANPLYDPAEYDVVVASGEQVTSGLLALTLQAMGCPFLQGYHAVLLFIGENALIRLLQFLKQLFLAFRYYRLFVHQS